MGLTLDAPAVGSPSHALLEATDINVDINRMAQVIRNIVSNALKFTPSGGLVTVAVERITDSVTSEDGVVSGPQEFLRLQVIDSGAGIAAVFLSHYYFNAAWHCIVCCPLFHIYSRRVRQENVPKLFHDIVQFNPGKLQKGGGSGFGLYCMCITMHELLLLSTCH